MIQFIHNSVLVASLKDSLNFWGVNFVAIKGRDFGYPESTEVGMK
jgi:hypothetical protein